MKTLKITYRVSPIGEPEDKKILTISRTLGDGDAFPTFRAQKGLIEEGYKTMGEPMRVKILSIVWADEPKEEASTPTPTPTKKIKQGQTLLKHMQSLPPSPISPLKGRGHARKYLKLQGLAPLIRRACPAHITTVSEKVGHRRSKVYFYISPSAYKILEKCDEDMLKHVAYAMENSYWMLA